MNRYSISDNSDEAEGYDEIPAEETSFAMLPETKEGRLEEGEVDDY